MAKITGTRTNIGIILFLFYFFVSGNLFGREQNQYRRCYVIAYEAFAGFNSNDEIKQLQEGIISLFTNKEPFAETKISPYDLTDNFFDPQKDIILFYEFGTHSSDTQKGSTYDKLTDAGVLDTYLHDFIRSKGVFTGGNDIEQFFLKSFDRVSKSDSTYGFGNGKLKYQSQSSSVFPLIVANIHSDISFFNANEYYFIVASKFNTAANSGNMRDDEQLRGVFGGYNYSEGGLAKKIGVIKSVMESLRSKMYEAFAFEFIFTTDGKYIGIRGNRIMPILGKDMSGVNLMIDSSVKFTQNELEKDIYTQDSTSIFFSQNNTLKIDSLTLQICSGNEVYCSHKIPLEDIKFVNSKYKIFPQSNILINKTPKEIQAAKDMFVRYVFYVKFEILGSPYKKVALGFSFPVSQSISNTDFTFKKPVEKDEGHIFAALIISLIILLSFGFVILRGMKYKATVTLHNFSKIFRRINECAVSDVPYLSWQNSEHELLTNILVAPAYKWGVLRKKPSLFVRYDVEGLDQTPICISVYDKDTLREFEIGKSFSIEPSTFSLGQVRYFQILFKSKESLRFDGKRYSVKVKCKLEVVPSFWGITGKRIRVEKELMFNIGEDLGSVWVGIDPGTCGSCAAFSTNSNLIHLSKKKCGNSKTDNKFNLITPSMLLFDKEAVFMKRWEDLKPGVDYSYGIDAEVNMNHPGSKFRSMKKLLGYTNKLKINPIGPWKAKYAPISVDGKRLCELLIKGIIYDMKQYVEYDEAGSIGYLNADERKELLDCTGCFSPKQAVVAIPNNFTMRKIQDMVDSVDSLKQFKHIIYTYEADAVLYYYFTTIPQPSNLCGERVMIFDMGGATINTTIYDLDHSDRKYYVDTVARIGYAIGGDTIDFAIINAVLSMPEVCIAIGLALDDNEKMKQYRDTHARQLLNLAFDLKIQVIQNFQYEREFLIGYVNLRDYIRIHLGITVDLQKESKGYALFCKKEDNQYPLFSTIDMEDTIYKNVDDAIEELSYLVPIDSRCARMKVIFSGRSTAFPLIEMRVKKALRKRGFIDTQFIPLSDLAKLSNIQASTQEILKSIVAIGACWYGINFHEVIHQNSKTFYSYVVERKNDSQYTDGYISMVSAGEKFVDGVIRKDVPIDSNVEMFDNFKVNFLQVVGKDVKRTLEQRMINRHKVITLVSHDVQTLKLNKVGVLLHDTDEIECLLEVLNGRISTISLQGNIEAKDISQENAEHYIFALKQDIN